MVSKYIPTQCPGLNGLCKSNVAPGFTRCAWHFTDDDESLWTEYLLKVEKQLDEEFELDELSKKERYELKWTTVWGFDATESGL